MYLCEMQSMIFQAGSSRMMSVTRPRMLAMAVGWSRSVIEIATRGSRLRLRAFWDCGDVRIASLSSSRPIHTGTVCGAPSARSVAEVGHPRCRYGFDEFELRVLGQRLEERPSAAEQDRHLMQNALVDEPC